MTLKVVMSPSEPVKTFVEQFVKLVADADLADFQRVLDMKGLRKAEQAQYLELFKATSPAASTLLTAAAASNSSALSVLGATPATALSQMRNGSSNLASAAFSARGEESRIKKLERLIKQRL